MKVGKTQGSGGAKFVVPGILIGVKWYYIQQFPFNNETKVI